MSTTETRQDRAERYETERLDLADRAMVLRAELAALPAGDKAARKPVERELRKTERANLRALRLRDAARGSNMKLRDTLKSFAPTEDSFGGVHIDGELIAYRNEVQEVRGVNVVVESAGQLERRLSLTRVAAGGLLFGPAGAIIGGLAQKRVDSRELYLLVDGPLYAWAVPVSPAHGAAARRFAAWANSAAKA